MAKKIGRGITTVADSSGVSDLTNKTNNSTSNSSESNSNNNNKTKGKSKSNISSTKISYKKMEAYLHPTLLDHKAAP